jgi:phosphopantothenoylcysteine decarboxylase/phosphopantothenate--cysteine ligase
MAEASKDFLLNNSHPAKDIQGSIDQQLKGKKICLCLTGSVAVVTAPGIARELMRHGAEIITVMSKKACELIQPELLQWATGNSVITNITGNIEHVAIAGERPNKKGVADLILICPATGNTISKIACGIDDTTVTTIATVALGSQTPMVVVPAMHESMFHSQILMDNLNKLKSMGITIIGPRIEENKAKIASQEEIVQYILNFFTKPKDFAGKNVIITAGPSREFIDSVRFISNSSSGKMGMAFAAELLARGAKVTVLRGPGAVEAPHGATVLNVVSAQQYVDIIQTELTKTKYNILISAAAIGDFTPLDTTNEKISSSKEELVVRLKRTPKVLDTARAIDKDIFIVAFKAETATEEKMIEKAIDRLQSASANLIVANNVLASNKDRGFQSDTNDVFVIDEEKKIIHLKVAPKRVIAAQVLDIIQQKLGKLKK